MAPSPWPAVTTTSEIWSRADDFPRSAKTALACPPMTVLVLSSAILEEKPPSLGSHGQHQAETLIPDQLGRCLFVPFAVTVTVRFSASPVSKTSAGLPSSNNLERWLPTRLAFVAASG